MSRTDDTLTLWLSERLADLAADFGIPGAAAAIVKDGKLHEAATGVVNLETRVAATRGALFQIGSITKTFTTTLILQLVEQGRLRLDDPVRRHLPHFGVASQEVSEALTIRHLLTHTSGIDGDFFPDTGEDADCVQNYVRACRELSQIHAPDDGVSYCNAAFVNLGGLLEQVTGETWDRLIRTRIAEPLGLTHLTTDYKEMTRFRVAVGHVSDPKTKTLGIAKPLHLPRGTGPTGATLHASAGNLARYGYSFLDPERALLKPQTIAMALEPRAMWPTHRWTTMQVGLAWALHEWDGQLVFGHDGGTIGQLAYLRIAPSANMSVALLTNGGPGKNLYDALYREIFGEFAGLRLPSLPALLDAERFDTARVLGTYANRLTKIDIVRETGRLRVTISPQSDLVASLSPPQTYDLAPIAEDACRVMIPETRTAELLVFHHFGPDGRARYASFNHRDLPRQ